MNIKKVIRRINWIIKSIPNILLALVFETKKHPWKYIYEYMTLSANKRYTRTDYYIKKYFNITKSGSDYLLERGDFKIAIPENFFLKNNVMLGFLTVYFDIIYTNQVKFPIPFIVIEGNYEYGEVRVKPGDYIIDAGANLGVFSTYYAPKVGSEGKIFAFEPMPEIYKIVLNQIKYTQFKNIVAVEEALGDKIYKTNFKYSEENIEGSSENGPGESVEVKVNTIDSYVKENNIKKIDFIKMDIEGAERYALVGATETIKKYKPRLSICVYHLPDDPIVIKNIILNIRPDYKYKMNDWKIYAY